MLLMLLLASADPVQAFPEQVPGLMEACLGAAVAAKDVSDTEDRHKYICGGDPAQSLWNWLERAGLRSYEQDVGAEGRWLTREFPLGACFKRTRTADGAVATSGLSCTIWIPRAADNSGAPKPSR